MEENIGQLPTENPHRQFKKTIGWVSIVLVLQIIVSMSIVILYSFTGFGYAFEVALIRLFPSIGRYLDTEFFLYLLQSFISLFTMIVIPLFFVRAKKLTIPPLISNTIFTGSGPKKICNGFCLALGGNFLFGLITRLLIFLLEKVGVKTPPLNITMPKDNPFAAVVFCIAVCVVAPLAEEYLFRGVILRALRPYGNAFAIFFSALSFALIHGNLHQTPATFAAGLVMGYFAVHYNSLAIPVVIHFLNNALSTLLELFPENEPSVIGTLTSFFVIGCTIYFVVALIGFVTKKDRRQKLKEGNEPLGKKFKFTITSFPFWLFFIVCALMFLLPFFTEQVAAFILSLN